MSGVFRSSFCVVPSDSQEMGSLYLYISLMSVIPVLFSGVQTICFNSRYFCCQKESACHSGIFTPEKFRHRSQTI